jgi:hypothetical protein
MNKIKWLRISYWAAALADFFLAVMILLPTLMGKDEYVYAMGLMSAVALSWGILLLFADQKPLERSWILVPTLIVIFLLDLVSLHALLLNVRPLFTTVPSLIICTTLLLLLFFSNRLQVSGAA